MANATTPRVIASPGDGSVFVGVKHGTPFQIPPWMARRVLDAGRRSGFWYEGGGGDRADIAKRLGPIAWRGSWDDLVKSDSSDFYYALFSNSKAGTAAVIKKVADPAVLILDALNDAGDAVVHEVLHGNTSRRKLVAFLDDCGAGLLRTAETMKATEDRLRAFIVRGERSMWPSTWRSGPTAASRVALRANKIRLDAIIRRKGVYFLGSDHVATLLEMDGKLQGMAMAPSLPA